MERLFTVSEAISSLVPTAKFSAFYNDDGTVNKINWVGGGTQPTEAEINTEISRLETEHDSLEYSRKRKEAYAKLNQFEMQFDDQRDSTTTWVDAVNAIKSQFPKP